MWERIPSFLSRTTGKGSLHLGADSEPCTEGRDTESDKGVMDMI